MKCLSSITNVTVTFLQIKAVLSFPLQKSFYLKM